MTSIPSWNSLSLPGAVPTQIDDAAVFPLGTEAVFRDKTTGFAATFVYVKAGATFVAGYGAVITKDTFVATLVADAGVGDFGIVYAALTSGKYGWAQIVGHGYAISGAAIAADAQLSSSATAGKVDDDTVGHDAIAKAYALELAAAADAVLKVYLDRPSIGVS